MNKHLQQYLDSFRLGKEFVRTFLIDLLSISIIVFVFTWFSSYTQARSLALLQGRTTEELQQMLISLSPQQLMPFMSALKWFLISSLIGLVVLLIGSVFLFSYSRARIWNHLQGKRVNSKNYWRWNLLNLSLLVPLLLFLAVILVVKLAMLLLLSLPEKLMPVFYITHTALMENIRVMLDGATLFYLVVLFMVIIFLVYDHFVKSYKIWESIGAGFSSFKKNWKKALLVAFFATVTALLATVILLPIRKALLFYPLSSTLLNVLLAAFFLSWLSLYVSRALAAHGHQ
ncbi:MAG: hypothetical protein Q8R47_02575 [Nanoarchaeota archaeon]|nr:hypothetical protein [Nanoarchaeota archaeon]